MTTLSKITHTVIEHEDLIKYADPFDLQDLSLVWDKVSGDIERGREVEGKSAWNQYIIVNIDEPFTDEVIDILKKNNKWGMI